MLAIEKFEPTHGTRFLTYAASWIRQQMSRNGQSYTRQVAPSVLSRGTKYMKEYREMISAGLEHAAAVALLAKSNKASVSVIDSAIRALRANHLSLDATIASDSSDSRTLIDTLVSANDTDEQLDRFERLRKLKLQLSAFRAKLTPREVTILDHRLLAEDQDDLWSLAMVAEVYGLSRERIRQIEGVLRKKLRHVLSSDLLPLDIKKSIAVNGLKAPEVDSSEPVKRKQLHASPGVKIDWTARRAVAERLKLSLEPREIDILERRLMTARPTVSVSELTWTYSISRQRVHQIEAGLRARLNSGVIPTVRKRGAKSKRANPKPEAEPGPKRANPKPEVEPGSWVTVDARRISRRLANK